MKLSRIKTISPSRLAVILFFAAFLIYGLLTVRDYGITWDEGIEHQSSLTAYKYMFPQVSEIVTDTVDFKSQEMPLEDFWKHYYGPVEDYKTYKDRYYGVAAQLPTTFIEHLCGFELSYQQIYLLRHVYTFLVFFAACICFWFICRRLTKSPWMALLGCVMLVGSPRILADSFYNIKDLIFLSFWVFATWCGICFIRKPGAKTMLALSILGGICTNVRIVGAILFVVCLPVAFLKGVGDKKGRKTLLWCLLTAVLSVLVYIGVSPVTWSDPVGEIINTLKVFSSYTTHTTPVYYMGEWINLTELPWHYLFVWVGITTPVLYLVLFALGTLQWGGRGVGMIKNKRLPDEREWDVLFIGLTVLIPVLYVLLARPVLYNGWRHFYFIYPAMILFAVFGFMAVTDLIQRTGKSGKNILTKIWFALFGVCLLSIAGWIVKNHPFEYVYFNLPSRSHIEGNFEKDYWSMSKLDAFQYICENDSSETITFWTYYPVDSIHMLKEEDQERLEMVDNRDDAEYIIHVHTLTPEEEAAGLINSELFDEWYRKTVDGNSIYSIYKRRTE